VSATNRSDVRQPDDHYATPTWATTSIIPYVVPDKPVCVLDPCAGTGAILREVRHQCPWAHTLGIEINPARASLAVGTVCRDALDHQAWPDADLVITNPPYAFAQSFLLRALVECASRGGTVCMLLRLNFLGAQKRAAFWRTHPCDIYVLSRRPSFTGKGTDATEYAWFVFSETRKERRWQVLDP
jgi:hypothetical protein